MLAQESFNPTQNLELGIDEIFKPLFSPEQWLDISDAFKIQEAFSVPDMYGPYSNIMSELGSVETDTVRDRFYETVVGFTTSILRAHSIEPNRDTPLRVLVDISEVFMAIQNLEDYEHVYTLFQGNRSEEEILLALLCEHTQYDEAFLLSCIKSFDSGLLTMLKSFCETKLSYNNIEDDEETLKTKTQAASNMKTLQQICPDAIGVYMTSMSMLLGQPLKTYIAISKNNLKVIEDDGVLADDFLSLCLISKEHKENPYTLWSQYSDEFTDTIKRAMDISSLINRRFSDFSQLWKAQNETI